MFLQPVTQLHDCIYNSEVQNMNLHHNVTLGAIMKSVLN